MCVKLYLLSLSAKKGTPRVDSIDDCPVSQRAWVAQE